MPPALQMVHRASQRSAACVHQDLSQGINSLGTIATLAPFVGFFGTLFGLINAFPPIIGDCDRDCWHWFIMTRLSAAMVPTALGLLIGITSLVFHRYLTADLIRLDAEMEAAGVHLMTQLNHHKGILGRSSLVDPKPLFGAPSIDEFRRDEIFVHRCLFFTGGGVALSWLLQTASLLFFSFQPLNSAMQSAFAEVLLTLAIATFIARPVWLKVLHGRRGTLPLLSANLTLCWTLASLIYRWL